MAGSLQRPPFKIIPKYKSSSSTKYKSIIKYQKLHLLRAKGSHQHNNNNNNCISINSSHQENPQQLQHQLLKQLKYCKSLSLGKLLLLLPSSSLSLFSNDSCWTATENEKYYKNLTTAIINYVQQQQKQQQQYKQNQQQQQHQQLQLQLLQILNKVFKSSKFRKNLLNRKKLQSTQFREIQLFYRKKSIV